jgi:hypothetical protein
MHEHSFSNLPAAAAAVPGAGNGVIIPQIAPYTPPRKNWYTPSATTVEDDRNDIYPSGSIFWKRVWQLRVHV